MLEINYESVREVFEIRLGQSLSSSASWRLRGLSEEEESDDFFLSVFFFGEAISFSGTFSSPSSSEDEESEPELEPESESESESEEEELLLWLASCYN